MPLITETGLGLIDAESYASVTYATTYHGARGNAAWADADLEAQEAALRKATDFIEAAYGPRFAGLRKTPEQALSWPRGAMGWGSLVPVPVQRATAELALRVLSGIELFPDAEAAISKEKVDVIETTYALPTGPRFGFVDAMLLPLLRIAGAAQSPFVKLARV